MIIVNFLDLPLLYPSTFFSLPMSAPRLLPCLTFRLFCLETAPCLGRRCIRKAIAKVVPTIISLVPMPGGAVLLISRFHGAVSFCFPYYRPSSVPFNFWEIWSQTCLKGSAFDLLMFLSSAPGAAAKRNFPHFLTQGSTHICTKWT